MGKYKYNIITICSIVIIYKKKKTCDSKRGANQNLFVLKSTKTFQNVIQVLDCFNFMDLGVKERMSSLSIRNAFIILGCIVSLTEQQNRIKLIVSLKSLILNAFIFYENLSGAHQSPSGERQTFCSGGWLIQQLFRIKFVTW